MPLMPAWTRKLSWQVVAISAVVGGIVHIASTLVVPKLATASAYHRLSETVPTNGMRVLPAATPASQILPYVGPDVRMAACRYDLSDGPVQISAVLPDSGWSLGLYTPEGDNFYTIAAQEMRRTDIRLTLAPPAERFLGMFNWGRVADTAAAQIIVPQMTGLVVVRAPLRGRAFQHETEAMLALAQCVKLQL
jgi:uncharacterized membrane protein